MTKRLIFSDTHLHTWTYGTTVDNQGYNTRLRAQANVLDQMLEYILEKNIKHVYFCGDLFHLHGRVPTQALKVAANFFNALFKHKINVRCIYGNHDMEDKAGLITALDWLPEGTLGNHWEDDDGLEVYGLPYTEDEEALKRFLGSVNEGSMILLHQGVAGVPLSSGYVLDERLTPKMIPDSCVAFTGHYHFHKEVSDNLTVVGNLTPLNWSDIDQYKGFLVYDDITGLVEQIGQEHSPMFISWNEKLAKHLDTSNLMNSFVRYTDEVKLKDQEEIRKALMKEGALTVEFPNIKIDSASKTIRKGEDITVEHIVKSFESEDMEPRRLEVGKEIREDRYKCRVGYVAGVGC